MEQGAHASAVRSSSEPAAQKRREKRTDGEAEEGKGERRREERGENTNPTTQESRRERHPPPGHRGGRGVRARRTRNPAPQAGPGGATDAKHQWNLARCRGRCLTWHSVHLSHPSTSSNLWESITSWTSAADRRALRPGAAAGGGKTSCSKSSGGATPASAATTDASAFSRAAASSSGAGGGLQWVPILARQRRGFCRPHRSHQVCSASVRKKWGVLPSSSTTAPGTSPSAGKYRVRRWHGVVLMAFHPHRTATRRWQSWHCHQSPRR